MRAYYFTPLQFARSNLQRQRLKISLIDDLNDPYELLGADLTDERMRAGYVPMRRHMAETKGVLCFSRSWSLPIMWSHYADRHRGACLGFDLSDHCQFPIQYSDRRVVFGEEMLNESDAEQLMLRLLCTKHAAWSYEQEVRFFCELDDLEGGLYFHPFDQDILLREVILGVRCEAELNELRELADAIDPQISVSKAALSQGEFKVLRA